MEQKVDIPRTGGLGRAGLPATAEVRQVRCDTVRVPRAVQNRPRARAGLQNRHGRAGRLSARGELTVGQVHRGERARHVGRGAGGASSADPGRQARLAG